MGKATADITMSLDGFIAGPNDRPGNGLGDGGEVLHEWVYGLKSWREPHGLEGGATGEDADILDEAMSAVGAVVLGRWMYECAEGWGDDPPFRVPVFVVTHDARDREDKGETSFTFVTNGIESALDQAGAAAGDKNVSIAGGASIIRQYLSAGLLDEIQIHVAPVLLGQGKRLFEGTGGDQIKLETARVVDSPAVTHLKYSVVK
jgi:dihydrofolate reductase